MNFASFNSLIRTIKLGVGLLNDSRPDLGAVFTTLGECGSVIAHRKPVVDNNPDRLAIFVELDHEAAGLLPMVSIGFVGVIAVTLADK